MPQGEVAAEKAILANAGRWCRRGDIRFHRRRTPRVISFIPSTFHRCV